MVVQPAHIRWWQRAVRAAHALEVIRGGPGSATICIISGYCTKTAVNSSAYNADIWSLDLSAAPASGSSAEEHAPRWAAQQDHLTPFKDAGGAWACIASFTPAEPCSRQGSHVRCLPCPLGGLWENYCRLSPMHALSVRQRQAGVCVQPTQIYGHFTWSYSGILPRRQDAQQAWRSNKRQRGEVAAAQPQQRSHPPQQHNDRPAVNPRPGPRTVPLPPAPAPSPPAPVSHVHVAALDQQLADLVSTAYDPGKLALLSIAVLAYACMALHLMVLMHCQLFLM